MSCGGCTPSGDWRTHVAACLFCHHATVEKAMPVQCTLDGRSVADHMDGSCPIGRTKDGLVRFAGLWWYGLPAPHRVWLWAFHKSHPGVSSWAGCGCVKVLKDFWSSIYAYRQKNQFS